MLKMLEADKAQIWVETVLYIGIGLAILALLLTVVGPLVAKQKDSIIIEQSMRMLDSLDSRILEVRKVAGTVLYDEIYLSRGELRINADTDTIEWFLADSHFMYSELNQTVSSGRIKALTEKRGDVYSVSLVLDYSQSINITCGEKEKINLQKGTFTLWMENLGNIPPEIDFSIK